MLHTISVLTELSQCFFHGLMSGYNDQKIAFSKNNGNSWTDIDFAQGVWTYNDLDNYIKEKTKIIDGEGNEDYPITLTFDEPTFRVIITLETGYQLDLTKSDFNELIGYDKKKLTDERNIGDRVSNLTEDTDGLRRPVYLNNADTAFSLILKKAED